MSRSRRRLAPSPAARGPHRVTGAAVSDLLQKRLSEVPLVFFDVETTGLSPESGDRICEVSMIRQEPDGTCAKWSSLIDPQRPVSPGAFAVNGITAKMLRGAPQFAAVADPVASMMADAVWVAHNAPFDLGFLRTEFALCGRLLVIPPTIDTVVLARRHFRFASNSLGPLAAELGVRVESSHRALADCRTTRAVFSVIVNSVYHDADPPVWTLVPTETDHARKPDRSAWDLLPVTLAETIRQNCEMEIVYVSGDEETTRRAIRVIDVVEARHRVYLVAYCMLRQEERHFRLDRIIEWKPKEQ